MVVSDLGSKVSGIEVVFVHNALEIGCVVRVALAYIFTSFRVGAQRPLELHTAGCYVVHVMRRDNLLRRYTLLDPTFKSLQNIVRGVDHRAICAVAERIGAGATTAMRHSRHHEYSIEIVWIADGALNRSVVVEPVFGGDGGVRPSGVLNHLAAVSPEGS